MGSVAEMKDLSGEKRRVVVLKNYSDKGSVTVMDVKSRKRKTVTKPSIISCKRRNVYPSSCQKSLNCTRQGLIGNAT